MNNRRILLLVIAFAVFLAIGTNLIITQQLAEHPLPQEEEQGTAAAPIDLVATASSDLSKTTFPKKTSNATTTTTTATASKARSSITHHEASNNNPNITSSSSLSKSKILGFADSAYTEYALRWYHRLTELGYSQHVIVTVDHNATNYFQTHHPTLRVEDLPYKPCISPQKDSRGYRRQIFGRRWKYVYDQLKLGYSILLTDVDNVFLRYVSLEEEFQQSDYDVFHAYSTSYPTYVFDEIGFTVCGGMSWLRAHPRVIRFVGTLVNRCHCSNKEDNLCKYCLCDDQVVLNEMLWKGKHEIIWDRVDDNRNMKPNSRTDYLWKSMTGRSSMTGHKVKIWDRSFAYRAPLPETCPKDNWVAMPLYVDRDVVVDVWGDLCANETKKGNNK